jgi:hypothetical protein
VPLIVIGFFLSHLNKYKKKKKTRYIEDSRECVSIGSVPYGGLVSKHIPLQNAKEVGEPPTLI